MSPAYWWFVTTGTALATAVFLALWFDLRAELRDLPADTRQPDRKTMRRTLNVLTILILTFTATLVAASQAHAAPGCDDDRICLYDTATSAGPWFEVEDVDTVRNRCISGLTPITSYIQNRTIYRWVVSTSNDCSANRGVIYPESAGVMGPTWSNRIRGMYRTSSTSLTGAAMPEVLR